MEQKMQIIREVSPPVDTLTGLEISFDVALVDAFSDDANDCTLANLHPSYSSGYRLDNVLQKTHSELKLTEDLSEIH